MSVQQMKSFIIRCWVTTSSAVVGSSAISNSGCPIIAIFAPLISPYNPNAISGAYYQHPSMLHLFGTNQEGQDLFSQNMYGTRVPLIVGTTAALVAVALGLLVGLFSGYFGGVPDDILMRITDFFLVVPAIVLMIVISALIGGTLTNMVPVSISRLIRSTALTLPLDVLYLTTRSLISSIPRSSLSWD